MDSAFSNTLAQLVLSCGGEMTGIELVSKYRLQKTGVRYTLAANNKLVLNRIPQKEDGKRSTFARLLGERIGGFMPGNAKEPGEGQAGKDARKSRKHSI